MFIYLLVLVGKGIRADVSLQVCTVAGGNIFQNKWIFHPGKVSCFGHFREEFPYFMIRMYCHFRKRNLHFLEMETFSGK